MNKATPSEQDFISITQNSLESICTKYYRSGNSMVLIVFFLLSNAEKFHQNLSDWKNFTMPLNSILAFKKIQDEMKRLASDSDQTKVHLMVTCYFRKSLYVFFR